MVLTKVTMWVSKVSTHRSATLTVHSRSTSCIFPLTGTFSSKVSIPESSITSVSVELSPTRSLTRSLSPPRLRNWTGSFLEPVRLSSRVIRNPGTRKQASFTRRTTSSQSIDASGSKMSVSGQNRIRVPVFLVLAIFLSSWPFLNDEPLKWPGTRSSKSSVHVLPCRSTSAFSFTDKAFTTDAPTP